MEHAVGDLQVQTFFPRPVRDQEAASVASDEGERRVASRRVCAADRVRLNGLAGEAEAEDERVRGLRGRREDDDPVSRQALYDCGDALGAFRRVFELLPEYVIQFGENALLPI